MIEHICTKAQCARTFDSEKDSAHTKYFLHMKREHKSLVHFACNPNCKGISPNKDNS